MRENKPRPTLVGPLILITIGVLLLLNQIGKLPWSIWSTLWRFWPVILILTGLEILVRIGRSPVLYVAVLLVAFVVLGGIIGYAVYHGDQSASPQPITSIETVVETLQKADRGRITLELGVGKIEVTSLVDSPNFVEGRIEYSRYSLQAKKSFQVRDGQAEFSLQTRSHSVPFLVPGEAMGEYWDLKFTSRIPLRLDVKSGAGKLYMDLSGLRVTQLDLKAGVGETMIIFPAAAGLTTASINAGIGNITVQIPDVVGTRVHLSKGLGSVNIESKRFTRSGDKYISTNYLTAENRLELEVKGGIGNITIR